MPAAKTPDPATAYAGAGLTLTASVVLFGVGGYFLDRQFGTLPLFLVVGTVLGMVGGFIHLFQVVAPGLLPFGRKPSKRVQQREEPENPSSTGGPRA